jgi:hypothetical protein
VKHKNYHSYLAFIDMLFNTLIGFVFLFIVAWLLINPDNQKKNTDAKGEFLITVTWPDKNLDDIDTWVQDPTENIVSFYKKESGFMHLDRDDLGSIGDSITREDGSVTEVHTNREVVTIRGIIPGEYVVNLHMYSKRTTEPTTATVDIVKLNPYSTVGNFKVLLTETKQEVTVLRFEVDATGKITDTSTLQKRLTTLGPNGSIMSGGVTR